MIHPVRLHGGRLFVPQVGIVPYIRGLQLLKFRGTVVFKVKESNGCVTIIRPAGGCYVEALREALMLLEASWSAIQLVRSLSDKERSNKKNPTGYAGVYHNRSNITRPYKATCPTETNEDTSSLRTAVEIRRAAVEERMRRNRVSAEAIMREIGL